MKTVEEIKERLSSKLKQMKDIDTRSMWFKYVIAEINILRWVLEDNEDVEND